MHTIKQQITTTTTTTKDGAVLRPFARIRTKPRGPKYYTPAMSFAHPLESPGVTSL